MGCFDFTYADNGKAVDEGRGYFYLSEAFVKATGIQSPWKFVSGDVYGCYNFETNATDDDGVQLETIDIDIFALYAAMSYLQRTKCGGPADENMEKYISLLNSIGKKKALGKSSYQEMKELEDKVRFAGIERFYDGFKKASQNNGDIIARVPGYGNQPPKNVVVEELFCDTMPMVISRKKLPYQTNTEVAEKWGFVTGSNPNQVGRCAPTFYKYSLDGGGQTVLLANNVGTSTVNEESEGNKIKALDFLSDTVAMPLSMQKKEICDRLSMVLTDYENGEADAETLYKMLVKIQNSWEDVITAQE